MKFIFSIILILIVAFSSESNLNSKLVSDTLKEVYVEQLWNIDKWDSRFRNTYYYNAENMLVLKNLEETYTDTGWTYLSLREFYYREDNKIFDFMASKWEDGRWIYTSRKLYNYDTIGNLIEYLLLLWNDGWVNKERETYSYNAESKITRRNFYIWNNTDWLPTSRNSYYYDDSDLLIEKIVESFDTIWTKDFRELNTYENSRLKSQIRQQWNGTQWIDRNRNTFAYDGNGMDSVRIEEIWTGSEWKPEFMITSRYNDKLILTEVIEYVWIGEWLPRRKDFYIYDDNSFLLSQTTQIWYENEWVNYQRNILELLSNVDNDKYYEIKIEVFPNPIVNSGYIKFSLPEPGSVIIRIINLFGDEVSRIITSYYAKGEHFLPISNIKLSDGIYFVRLENKFDTATFKLIITE